MNSSVEVYTVDDGGEDVERQPSQQTKTRRTQSLAGNGLPTAAQQEPLVEAMQSLREQLDRLEKSYDATRTNAGSTARRGDVVATREGESRTLFGSSNRKSTSIPAASPYGAYKSAHPDSSSMGDELLRSSSRQPSLLTPSSRLKTASTSFGISSPLRFEPSVITEDPSLQSERQLPPTRTPPRSALRTQTMPAPNASVSAGTAVEHLPPGSTTTSRSRATLLTPSRSLQSPPPLASTPFSTQKGNQSFVSCVEPEPVQTPSQSVSGEARPARSLGAAPELRLLDSLIGTVEALKKRMDEQEIRLEEVERKNVRLEDDVLYWRAEAARWQTQSLREQDRRDWRRDDENRQNGQRNEDIPELDRDEERRNGRRDWQTDNALRESPRVDSRRSWEREDYYRSNMSRNGSRRSNEWEEATLRSADRHAFHASPAYRPNSTSPGSQFVDELSEKLPLDPDQYEVLVSLMNRHFGDQS